MSWVYLVFVGLLEVVWTTFLKFSDGFGKPGYSATTIVGMIASFYLLSQATEALPLGIAYAIWTGTGVPGVAIAGILALKEVVSVPRIIFVLLLLVGVVGLKFTSSH